VVRLPSTEAFSIFRSARAFASTRELVGKVVALGLPSFVVHVAKPGDRRRAQGDGTELNDHGAGAASKRCTGGKPERQIGDAE